MTQPSLPQTPAKRKRVHGNHPYRVGKARPGAPSSRSKAAAASVVRTSEDKGGTQWRHSWIGSSRRHRPRCSPSSRLTLESAESAGQDAGTTENTESTAAEPELASARAEPANAAAARIAADEKEDPELAAYNRYLAGLAERSGR